MKTKITMFLVVGIILAISPIWAHADKNMAKPWDIYNNESPMTRMMAKFFGIEENQVVVIGQNCHYPDDLIVTLFISKRTDLSPQKILNWRKEARSWPAIMESAGYPVSNLFIDMRFAPTPLFAHAYGQYARWKKNPAYKITVYDKEIRNLAGLRFMVEKFRVTPLEAMRQREEKSSFTEVIMERI